MADDTKCRCYMFRNRGTCYHVGYRPTFRDQLPVTPSAEPVYVTPEFVPVRLSKVPTSFLDKVTARVDPLRTDDLQPGVIVGLEGEYQAAWVIEAGPYEGQWAWLCISEQRPPGSAVVTGGNDYYWHPACDLLKLTP